MSKRTLLALLPALLLAACDSHTPSTKPSTMPGAETTEHVPVVLQLVARPSLIRANSPSDDPAEPKDVLLTLIVRNVTERTYRGEAPTAALARFSISADGEEVWSWPNLTAEVVTPITLAPHQSTSYNVTCRIPDARVYKGKTLTARASFIPAHANAEVDVEVR